MGSEIGYGSEVRVRKSRAAVKAIGRLAVKRGVYRLWIGIVRIKGRLDEEAGGEWDESSILCITSGLY